MNKYHQMITDAVDYADTHFDVEVRDYSGRGMYGKYCLAITGTARDCLAVMVKAAQTNADTFLEGRLLDYAQDNMGFTDVVWYWPHIPWEGS